MVSLVAVWSQRPRARRVIRRSQHDRPIVLIQKRCELVVVEAIGGTVREDDRSVAIRQRRQTRSSQDAINALTQVSRAEILGGDIVVIV